ncbi:MAG: succinyl-diaminopimelate desuccinylase [Alphaproteobacteria bacterium]|nr:succinyl-diaminopimelate desuccinylase [Alphaproteobacteria bacterium]
MTTPPDPITLSAELIRCPSVTPADAGGLGVLQSALARLGFACTRLPFAQPGTPDVDNLYARYGDGAPNFCFAGHMDVVPPGDPAAWASDPFAPRMEGGILYGRGAADMKCAIAAFVTAAGRIIRAQGAKLPGSISLLITGDEEGPAINGTVRMLDWLRANHQKLDHCLVGEPTSAATLGDMVKIGRRGSLNVTLTFLGAQGHVAYPHQADNPIPRLIAALSHLQAHVLDNGNEHFQASNLEVTSVDVGNMATNVIPGQAVARLNIRFNDMHSSKSLIAWIRQECETVTARLGGDYRMEASVTGEAFLTPPGPFSALVANAIAGVTGAPPELSTTGGTSDARFIKDHCPVVEFGLVGLSQHKVDEHTAIADVHRLADIYEAVLRAYFAAPPVRA